MATAFTRQLGAESGVQLNPLRDESEIPSNDNSDQAFAILMRATRGRIDRPFVVTRGNVRAKLGRGEQIRKNTLNEAWVHVVEALDNGAAQAVVQRLISADAANKWAVIFSGSGAVFTATVAAGVITGVTVTAGGKNYPPGKTFGLTATGAGSGASLTATTDATGAIISTTVTSGGTGFTSAPAISVATVHHHWSNYTNPPSTPYLLAVLHADCHNDGITLSFHADKKTSGGLAVDNDRLTLRLSDSAGDVLHEFTGSLDVEAKDDYGRSAYLPDIVASQTDAVEVRVGVTGDDAVIKTTSPAYGYAASGSQQWNKTPVMVLFTEGSTAYTTEDYAAARTKLKATQYGYAYIASGGTQSPALLAQLVQLAYDTNCPMRFDVPGTLNPEAAQAFVEQLNMGENVAHLCQAFWAPLKSDDPTGINPKMHIGVSALNIAYACARNAQTNALGFAPKHYPIAGKSYPINRSNITQTYTPDQDAGELSDLARAKINPVIYETYSGGGRYVFFDSLTCAQVENSLKKLASVVDMSTSVDALVVRVAKDHMQLPMEVSVKKTKDFLKGLFEGAETSGWIKKSTDPGMGGMAWRFEVKPNAARPYDRMDVSYWLHYEGTNRQTFVTQTISK